LQDSKKSNHRVNVVEIREMFPHPDPETTSLELIRIDGYQVVVRKGQFVPGDLAVYIQPDSVVPQTEPFRFLWEQYQTPNHFEMNGVQQVDYDTKVPERRRRITVRKFRKEWSEGLLLPVSDFPVFHGIRYLASGKSEAVLTTPNGGNFRIGDDVSDLLGITHYDPDTADGTASTKSQQEGAPRRKYPKTMRGWFFFLLHKLGFGGATRGYQQEVSFHLPTYDVEAFKNHSGDFQPDDEVVITEKIHGSNARYVFLDGVMYQGSRNQWKKAGDHVWSKALAANPWIEHWCRLHPGYALYGEVTPTQKGFDYGATKDKPRFFLFDIRTPDDEWLWELDEMWDELEDYTVPVLYVGLFSKEHALAQVDGKSAVGGAKHIREGVVIRRIHAVNRRAHRQLKLVSNAFLEKDSKAA
jgi:hypothetical protein